MILFFHFFYLNFYEYMLLILSIHEMTELTAENIFRNF